MVDSIKEEYKKKIIQGLEKCTEEQKKFFIRVYSWLVKDKENITIQDIIDKLYERETRLDRVLYQIENTIKENKEKSK
jgi:hypothetical protein